MCHRNISKGYLHIHVYMEYTYISPFTKIMKNSSVRENERMKNNRNKKRKTKREENKKN